MKNTIFHITKADTLKNNDFAAYKSCFLVLQFSNTIINKGKYLIISIVSILYIVIIQYIWSTEGVRREYGWRTGHFSLRTPYFKGVNNYVIHFQSVSEVEYGEYGEYGKIPYENKEFKNPHIGHIPMTFLKIENLKFKSIAE